MMKNKTVVLLICAGFAVMFGFGGKVFAAYCNLTADAGTYTPNSCHTNPDASDCPGSGYCRIISCNNFFETKNTAPCNQIYCNGPFPSCCMGSGFVDASAWFGWISSGIRHQYGCDQIGVCFSQEYTDYSQNQYMDCCTGPASCGPHPEYNCVN